MIRLLLASLLVSFAAAAEAQPAPPVVIEIPAADVTQELELNDGSSMIGRVESIADGQFVFRTTSGVEMKVDTATVRSLRPVTGRVVRGELWRDDPNPTRLFFAPTGRSLKKGEAYFGVYETLMPFVQVGVTDRFSVGVGTPLVFGDFTHPFWVTPKFQIVNSGRTQASVGVLHFFNIDHANVGIAYGVITEGSADSAVTIGGGYAYARNGHDDGGAPLVMVGGEHRVSRRIKLVTENYLFEGGGLASGGLRVFGEKLSADFGLVSPLVADGFYLFPMINVVRKF